VTHFPVSVSPTVTRFLAPEESVCLWFTLSADIKFCYHVLAWFREQLDTIPHQIDTSFPTAPFSQACKSNVALDRPLVVNAVNNM